MTTNARTTSNSVIMARSEALGPQQRVGQVEQQAERDEAGERIIEDHGFAPLQPFTGIGVAYARGEEAESEGQHDDIPHERSSLLRIRNLCAFPGERIAVDQPGPIYSPKPIWISDRDVPPGA